MSDNPFKELGLSLTKSEAKVIFALYMAQGNVVTTEYLLGTLYPPHMIKDMKMVLHDIKQDTWVLSGTRTLRVFISKIRRKLGIEIHSQYHEGYFLKEEALKRCTELLGHVSDKIDACLEIHTNPTA